MFVNLVVQLDKFPRTMTRQEWYSTYRWLRTTARALDRAAEQGLALLREGMVFGKARSDLLDDLCCPPLLVIPEPRQFCGVDLRPGAVNHA